MSFFHFRSDWTVAESLATPERVFLDRRRVIAGLGLGGLSLALGRRLGAQPEAPADAPGLDFERLTRPAVGDRFADRFPAPPNEAYDFAPRPLTPERVASRYNNFYEFTLDKVRVWDLAHGYPVADARTNKLLPPDLLKDPILYPAQELLDALEFGAAATLTDPNRAELLARFKSA